MSRAGGGQDGAGFSWGISLRILLLAAAGTALAASGCEAYLSPGEPLGGSCGVGSSFCSGECVTLAHDDRHCGACDAWCGPGESCERASCEEYCVAGQSRCGERCTNVLSSRATCGGCDASCSAEEFCDRGACSSTCTGALCPDPDGGAPLCVHWEEDPDHCGGCGQACGPGRACEEGMCVTSCPAGRVRCGDECVDVKTSARHCGACGNGCPSGVACTNGGCGSACVGDDCACPDDRRACDGACVDLSSNLFHCGACATPCTASQRCEGGVCRCPAGGEPCGDECVDLQKDELHCGACGNPCSGGQTCQAGNCACAAGLTECDGLCVDTDLNPRHCGSCNHPCSSIEECVEGICRYVDGDDCGGGARDVSITRVVAYQSIEIPLFDGPSAVPLEARGADLVRGREALFRIFVQRQPGFAARELSARVHLQNGESTLTYHHRRLVNADSSQGSLESTFRVTVPAESIQADTRYWIELVECGAPPAGGEGTTRLPAEADLPLGARATGVIKVAFLPILHDGLLPDTSEANLKRFSDAVLTQYPTTAVEVSVLPSIGSGQSGVNVNLSALLDVVRGRRNADSPPSDVYYYGMIRPAANFGTYCQSSCTTGIAYVTSANNVSFRAGVGMGYGSQSSAGTFVHELGHNHGRDHAPCGVTGDAAFPHPNGSIGVYGYDFLAATLKDPSSTRDFMSYCNPTWVSDYTYRALTTRVAHVNGVTSSRRAPSSPIELHVLRVTERELAWGQPTTVDPSSLDPALPGVVYDETGAVVAHVPVYRVEVSDGGGFALLVPPPRSGWFAVGLESGPALPYP